jgi:UDP-glucuronate 4-epimerase
MRKILVTGAAGFIGYHVAKRLLEEGMHVVGVDDINPYYSVILKKQRLEKLYNFPGFSFHQIDIAHPKVFQAMWEKEGPIDAVIHLAAQAGVRYSLENPLAYAHSNLLGFSVVLEQCRQERNLRHLVYASTSSVYGGNEHLPFREDEPVNTPLSFYAATKRSNELMAESYNHLYDLPVTGLRYFTVYGPWGRPDMALFKFTHAIMNGQSIDIYNNGQMARDYTFIDDIVDGTLCALYTFPKPKVPGVFHPIYNLGRGCKQSLLYFIEKIEDALGKKALKNYLPLQAGDVEETLGCIEKANKQLGYQPKISLEEGVTHFVKWYRKHHNLI